MSEQRDDQTATNRPDDLPLQHQVTDPITGTTAAGPLDSGPAAGPTRGSWGTAARWLAIVFLLVLFLIVLYWMSGAEMRNV